MPAAQGISFEALVRHRATIDDFVSRHRVMSVVAFVVIYIVTVAVSFPGATFLTVTGGFLFGLATGAIASCCVAASGKNRCRMVFDPSDALTPQLIAALVGLGLLALMPVVVKRWRAHARAVT